MNSIIPFIEPKNNQESFLDIDKSLSNLTQEAKMLFDLLDAYSSRIRMLEQQLQKINANFPFKQKIKEGKDSLLKPALDRHIEGCIGTVHSFYTKDFWYLSWEADDKSKNFRLFLIVEETEFVFFDYADCIEQFRWFDSKVKFKRPLIETDIQTRLQYSEYLLSFIDSFSDYLRQFRVTIELGGLPF